MPSARHDAVIDKLIGDEVMAFFVRGISGPHYRRRAVQAGMELLEAVGYGSDEGPWLDLGLAVNAGVAYVGNVGGAVVDFTARCIVAHAGKVRALRINLQAAYAVRQMHKRGLAHYARRRRDATRRRR